MDRCVKLRVGVIRTLQQKLDEDEKENAIRDYVFDHLWLLDPSWERAKGTEYVEGNLNKFLKKNTDQLTPEEKKARIDIGYRTATGRHVIIELKRASVRVGVDRLAGQVRKYRSGARKILDKTKYKDRPLEIVCVLGEYPLERNSAADDEDIGKTLAAVDARIVYL